LKIKKIKPLEDGMSVYEASSLWDKVEMFASYSFNRSHAVEYSVISYWSMWVRVRYPAEYFAACLSIAKDEKLSGLVTDARKYGIELLPPDVNLSSDKFTIPDDKHLLAPFSSVMGISENTARRIVELRALQPTGKFETVEDFKKAAAAKGAKVNARVVANLEAVGALASIDPTVVGARDMLRRKIQIELMPGLIVDAVKADRQTDVTDKFLRAKVIHLIQEYKKCEGCDLASEPHPAIQMKSNVKFMVVSDCPSWQEEKAGKLLQGDAADFVKLAITEAGLKPSDGYYTTVVKAKKSDKFLSNSQINGCSKFLDRELELIKPAIIVALGSAAIKRFVPGVKGSVADLAGKVIYDPKLDASIVCGINAQQILFDPTKAEILQGVFEKVADILS
jgi:uracil-DNA glycosylase family 4